jgi:O-succinylbenzoic acid--CoA ligase
MYDWLSHRVRATPERTALVRASTGETLDFAGLDAMVDDLAGRLVALGVEPGDHLGMVIETRLAAVCTVHAADRLGAVLAPLGADLTPPELRSRIDAADVTVLVCSETTEEPAIEAFDGPICSVDEPHHEAVVSLADTTPIGVDRAEWDLCDTRLLLFTSGTTGDPKVVRLTVGNLLWSAVASALRLGLHRDDRWLVGLPLNHMGGLSPVLRMPLYGLTVVLRESFEAGRTADDIGNYDVTCVSLVPTMLTRMLDLRGTLADSLRVVLLGGAPAPDELIERCRDFSVPVYPTYGMTETASQVATATPREAFDDVGTVGRPLFWTEVSVRDDDGARTEPNGIGEFVVDGPTVSPGYYGAPEATDAAFGPHGLRTGDVGYRDDDGRLFVLGRIDDRIITGGQNVYPREVVDALRSHPMVDDAAVVGLADDEWGEVVGALVVPGDDDLTVGAIDEHCRESLAPFKLPRVVAFADDLPRTESGTVRRDAVRETLAEGTAIPDAEARAPDALGDESTEPSGAAATTGDADAEGTGSLVDDAETAAGDGDDGSTRAEEGEEDEAFLIGGTDWELEGPSDESAGTAGAVTDAPRGEQSGRTDPEPDPPDFVKEVLPGDAAGDSSAEGDATSDAPPSETGDGSTVPGKDDDEDSNDERTDTDAGPTDGTDADPTDGTDAESADDDTHET